MKLTKCKICKNEFVKTRPLQPTCTRYECMVDYANQHLSKSVKEKKKQANKSKKEFNQNDKVYLKELAQKIVNQYARIKDEKERGYVCCTCGHSSGQMDGGHFLPTSSYSAIRYNTNQIHLQCKKCNRFNGGMPKEYRIFMINRYGLQYVEKLEATKGELRQYSTEYYQKLISVIRRKTRKLQKTMV